MPSNGDKILYSQASTQNSGFNPNKTGANQTWNFSKLKPVSQDYYNYVNSINTPYLLYYANTIGLKTADTLNLIVVKLSDIFDFHKKTDTKFSIVGKGFSLSGIPLPANYDVEDKIYNFPLKYKDKDSTPFHYSINDPTGSIPFSYGQSGWRVTTVDGWGTVATPYGSFSCLRVKTKLITIDSVTISGFSIPIPRTSYEYRFLTNGEKIPILQVNGNETFGNFTISQIRYRDVFRPLPPRANFVSSEVIVEPGGEVTLSDQSTNIPEEWLWNIEPNTITYKWGTNAGSQNPNVKFEKEGTYTVSLKVTNKGGTNELIKKDYISVQKKLGVFPLESGNGLQLFPNPSQEEINIVSAKQLTNPLVSIYNLQGQLMLQSRLLLNISLKDLPQGNYIINIRADGFTDNKIITKL
jgi:PKD repeat protein